jgi:WD40 repeat protein/serine/threonine protein kinase
MADFHATFTLRGDEPHPNPTGLWQETLIPDPRKAEDQIRLGGRYVPIRSHARGGLGEVSVARDDELGREVALKTMQDRVADDPDSRARFVREAEITGNLEHPGIVPVYGLGAGPDGRPFYAMRFIEGESLEHAILRFHAAEGPRRDPGERRMELLRLLARFCDVCNAIAYAHSRGILHRDLKPANVMLGAHGETLVVDWGLAKVLGRPEGQPPPEPGSTLAFVARLVESSSSSETIPGHPIGTPSFMSPEQADGRVEDLGPASDIYNLGATLYALLTGQAPFVGGAIGALLTKVRQGEFLPPRAVASGPIPRALEAICLKAMALRPEDRHASALALRDDIQRWLADEPVLAYRESLIERLLRWSRRHRTWVLAATTVLFGLLIVMSVATAVVDQARQRERFAREESDRLATSLELDKGLSLCEEGATARGMLRLAHALTIAPAEARDLRRTILTNLAAWRRPLSPLRAILSHEDAVRAVAISPDGRIVATAGDAVVEGEVGGEARLWEAARGRPLGAPLAHSDRVVALAFSPDGRVLATASNDRTARLWEVATRRPLGPPLKHRAPVAALAFSPDSRTLVTAAGSTVHFWNASDGRAEDTWPEQPARVLSLAIRPDGRALLTGDEEGNARLWDLANGQLLGSPLSHPSAIHCLAFTPDGRTIATGDHNGIVRFWETATGQRLLARLAHRAAVYSLAIRSDGRTIVTGSEDNTARLWEVETGQPISLPLEHRGSVLAVAMTPDGRTFLTGSGDGSARLWDVPHEKPWRSVLPHPGPVLTLAYRPDGRVFATGGRDGTAQLWDTAKGEPLGPPIRHPGGVRALAFSPDGRRLLLGGADGTARLRDATTHEPLGPPLVHAFAVSAVAFSPDARIVATADEGENIRFWDAPTGQPLGPPREQPAAVGALAFHPAGKLILVASGSRATFQDVASGKPTGPVLVHQGPIYGLAFRADGRVVATASEDNSARLWETETGHPLGASLEHPASVRAIAFAPDGRTLATGCGDHRARFWDAETCKPLGPPLRHNNDVSSVAFAPDGRTLATGCGDPTARLWDVPTPLPDDPARIRLWVEVLTGMALDIHNNATGIAVRLEDGAWKEAHERLEAPAGPPLP